MKKELKYTVNVELTREEYEAVMGALMNAKLETRDEIRGAKREQEKDNDKNFYNYYIHSLEDELNAQKSAYKKLQWAEARYAL